tara:strand:+ start:1090 stop:1407 length:318 start_codon:yes stop_codon:yes gene_type:complete
MNKKLIGRFGVDSGQVMLVDPCYVKDFESNEFNFLEKNKKNPNNSFSYNGACNQTCFTDAMGGILKNKIGAEMAVVASTGYGDGGYDVYATYEDGRVKKLEVEFF